MPTESRVVSFTNAEVLEAFVDYSEKIGRPLARGGTTQLTFSNDLEVKVTLNPGGKAYPVSFNENQTAVALILFCNKKGIPIARRAVKSLQVTQDTVSLHLVINT